MTDTPYISEPDTAMTLAFDRAGFDGSDPDPAASPAHLDSGEPAANPGAATVTAAVCDSLALFGGAPDRDEFDHRDVYDEDDAVFAIEEAIRIMVDGVTMEGTQLYDEREPLLWGFANMLHSQAQRVARALDKLTPEMRDLERAQDGSEVNAWQLQLITERAQNLSARRDAFEHLRDVAAVAYRAESGEIWRPRYGSHTSRNKALTSAAIDARDFRRARKAQQTQDHLPQGTLIAVAGGRDVTNTDAIWATLDRTRAKYPDMILLHGAAPGTEKIASSWADARGVDQVLCRPNWEAHGKAAPFRRNDDLLNFLPKGLIAFPGTGITGNLVDKARLLGIPVYSVTP